MRYQLISITALAALALAGCGSDPAPAPAPVKATPPPAATSAAPAADVTAQQAYIKGLRAIDAGPVANEERALSRAEDICLDLQQGEFTGAKLNERVAERLSGGSAQITGAQAGKVVELAKKTVCQ
jgi:hypothetical protein